jgi:hypothetical protein
MALAEVAIHSALAATASVDAYAAGAPGARRVPLVLATLALMVAPAVAAVEQTLPNSQAVVWSYTRAEQAETVLVKGMTFLTDATMSATTEPSSGSLRSRTPTSPLSCLLLVGGRLDYVSRCCAKRRFQQAPAWRSVSCHQVVP